MLFPRSIYPEIQRAREHRRVAATLVTYTHKDCKVRYRLSHDRSDYNGDIMSVSGGGLFIRTQRLPEKGALIFLDFRFCRRPVKCVGRVIYTQGKQDANRRQGFGVKFTQMAEKDLEYIRKEIEDFYRMLSPT